MPKKKPKSKPSIAGKLAAALEQEHKKRAKAARKGRKR